MKLLLPLLLCVTLYAHAQRNSTLNWLDLMHLGLLKTKTNSVNQANGNRISTNVHEESSVKVGGDFNQQSVGCSGSQCNISNAATKGSYNIRLPRAGLKSENRPFNDEVSFKEVRDVPLELEKELAAEEPDNAPYDTPAL